MIGAIGTKQRRKSANATGVLKSNLYVESWSFFLGLLITFPDGFLTLDTVFPYMATAVTLRNHDIQHNLVNETVEKTQSWFKKQKEERVLATS